MISFRATSLPAGGAAGLALVLFLSSCGLAGTSSDASLDGLADGTELAIGTDLVVSAGSLWDSNQLHTIEFDVDPDAYDAMIQTYISTGEKDWIVATITIDGMTHTDVGVRLKGNSSLRGLTTATAENPEDLPWLISLDKYVDDQNHEGTFDIVIRSNSTATSMNEAVALELLGAAGLATEEAISTSLTVNGGASSLRLAIEHPDAVWEDTNFPEDGGLLYKADSAGDYSYRGDDAAAYDDVFNQKVGDDNLVPLTEFLDFINNSDDATFGSGLDDWLDVDAFATYLAYQDLIGNFDDIDGRGNNSYLHFDEETDLFTVVNWDLNLAFNTANVGGGGAPGVGGAGGGRPAPAGGGQGGAAPGEAAPGAAVQPGAEQAGAGQLSPPSDGNILAERFQTNDAFVALINQATSDLTEALFTSGLADEIVNDWTSMLQTEATALVDASTVDANAAAITAEFPTR